MAEENKDQEENIITVRLILPSGVKEICGNREVVADEVWRLSQLESDIGKSFAEVIPNHQEQINFEEG